MTDSQFYFSMAIAAIQLATIVSGVVIIIVDTRRQNRWMDEKSALLDIQTKSMLKESQAMLRESQTMARDSHTALLMVLERIDGRNKS
jgi:hypothetical protein